METLLRKLTAEAVGTKEEPTAWPTALVLALLAALVVIVFSVASVMAGRKSAAMAHKLDKLENGKRQKKALWDKLEESEERRVELDVEIKDVESQISKVGDKILALDESREDFRRKLSAVASWDDVL